MSLYNDYLFFEPTYCLFTSGAFCQTYPYKKNKIRILEPEILNTEENQIEWFVGFSEAESTFSISSEGNLSFRINLHSDDRISLEYIKYLLRKLANRDIGSIVESRRVAESYYSIIPIFTKYFMTTSKHLDFSDFKKAAEIKAIAYLENRSVNNKELLEILKLKSILKERDLIKIFYLNVN